MKFSRTCSHLFTTRQDWHPAFGFVNNCDGSRSHSYCDYRQQ